jgi:cell division protein FtsB
MDAITQHDHTQQDLKAQRALVNQLVRENQALRAELANLKAPALKAAA